MITGSRYMSMKTKLAATLCVLFEIPHFIAKNMSEDEVLAMFEFDHHPIRYADGGPNVFWNLRPLLIPDHAAKTVLDAKDRAKERKVRKAVDLHKAKMQLKEIGAYVEQAKRSRWPKRKLRT